MKVCYQLPPSIGHALKRRHFTTIFSHPTHQHDNTTDIAPVLRIWFRTPTSRQPMHHQPQHPITTSHRQINQPHRFYNADFNYDHCCPDYSRHCPCPPVPAVLLPMRRELRHTSNPWPTTWQNHCLYTLTHASRPQTQTKFAIISN